MGRDQLPAERDHQDQQIRWDATRWSPWHDRSSCRQKQKLRVWCLNIVAALMQELPCSTRVSKEGVSPQNKTQCIAHRQMSSYWPWTGHPRQWWLFLLLIAPFPFPAPASPHTSQLQASERDTSLWRSSSILCQVWRAPWPWVRRMFSSPLRTFVAFLPAFFCAPTGFIRDWQQNSCSVPVTAFPMPCEGSRPILTSCYSSFIHPTSHWGTEWLSSRSEWCFVRHDLLSWEACVPGSQVWYCGCLFKHSSWTVTI